MSLIQGLPSPGSDVSFLITRVHVHPLCELVEFWAKFGQERAADYLTLAKDIQSHGTIFREFEANPGDQCLAQTDGTWFRARIVSQNGSQYIVFLIDKGITYSTVPTMLAWGKKEHFNLPPEVEFCVLANVLPLSTDNRWSPMALEFLQSLSGKSVTGQVQNFLNLHRMFVLNIPTLSKQMYEMGFARKVSADMFQDFLVASIQSKTKKTRHVEPVTSLSIEIGERLQKKEMYMYPELHAGTVETVVITEVTSPQRIFCQLKVFSQELKKLSLQLTQCCDGRTATCTIDPEMIGFPCAARASDGMWYRSVLQQVFPINRVVEVLNVDCGTKQIVQVENVRPLASEFFRMPVVTYNCSLHGIIDKGVGWTSSQIEYLRSLLLFKTVIAKFEYQSITEGVYYVTLYGDENSNINSLFGSKERCLLQCEKILEDYAIPTSGHSRNNPMTPLRKNIKIEDRGGTHSQFLPVENLPIGSTHGAFVQYVSSPSEFWIIKQNFGKELDNLMNKMATLYQNDLIADVVKNPTVGLYCAAKAEDGDYYRAIVTEISNTKVNVHFLDYGNSEAVDSCCIKALKEEFKKLPTLALKCNLVDVAPKGGEWSEEACELFAKIVLDKALNVHVVKKEDDNHYVQLTDPDAQGEKDLAKLLWAAGFAEQKERKRPSKTKMCSQFVLPSTAQYTGTSVKPQNTIVSGATTRRCATFKEQMFSIGSLLDVNVSYIESPNDFWCQLVQSARDLKFLMFDLQAHYKNSQFQPLVENACVAQHPDNGMWYRALIVHKHETSHVDVLFVDYGQTKTVSIFDLRSIEKQFLLLPGQAFRCSLFNLVDPTSAINDWTGEAVDRFHTFVETAANDFVILKCTVYAVMYSEQKIVFNIVDLETPFESVCTSLVNLVESTHPKAPSRPSFRLDTYYYSTHNVKTGTEEKVTVTTIKDVNHFYCQLQRNSDVLEKLQIEVANLCQQLQRVNVPPVFGTLCFAKYTDGYWYRGQIKATTPSVLVHFVDYGDTIEVDKSDLLPIPKEASNIMAVPVQALLCGLSDIPDDVPEEANSWFQTSSTECEFKALIVAKEPDGKLAIELYQGRIQVNAKIKKLFDIKMDKDLSVVCKDGKPVDLTVTHAKSKKYTSSTQAFVEIDDTNQNTKDTISFVPKSSQLKNPDSVKKKISPTLKPRQNAKGYQQLYIHPHQRNENEKPKCTEPQFESRQKVSDTPAQANADKFSTIQQSSCPPTDSWINNEALAPKIELPKLTDLPSSSIRGGMTTDVYISHSNGPLSFYVQLVKDEEDIFSIVNKLNNPESTSKCPITTEVHPGDLVQAEFTDDNSWYRAVVKQKQDTATAVVEFFDFGNTASVPLSKMSKIDKSLLQYPVFGTHCMLQNAAGIEKGEVPDTELTSAFESAIGNVGEKKLKCKFIQHSGTVWEVCLENEGIEVDCKIGVKKVPSVSNEAESCCLKFKEQEFSVGQQIAVYITAITDAQIFWCQSADSEELDNISERASEAGDVADSVNLGSLSIGSPCLAFFSEDQCWHRAEILDKNGEDVFVLFVDYGNSSQVKLSDMRLIPPDLIQNTVQAFQCELEGFNSSEGSWESNAQDELLTLTADQLLQLTVTHITKKEGKTMCYVRLECNDQVINESMKKFWENTVSDKVLNKSEMLTEVQASVTVQEAVLIKESSKVESCGDSDGDVSSKEQDQGEMVEVQKEAYTGTTENKSAHGEAEQSECVDEGQILTNVGLENLLASFVTPLKENEDQMCSTSYSQIPESFNDNISAITMEPIDSPLSDVAFEETVLNSSGRESEPLSSSYEAPLTNKHFDEQDLSAIDSIGTEDLGFSLDECFLEITDESGLTDSFDSLQKEARHYSNFDKYCEEKQAPENPEVIISEARPVSKTTARLVPCLSLSPTGKISPDFEICKNHVDGSQQNEDFFVVSSSVLLQDSSDSDMEFLTAERDIEEKICSPSLTSAQMVPCLTLSPTVKPCPPESPEEASTVPQQNEALFILPLCDHLSQTSPDKKTLTPELISETTTDSSSVSMNEGSFALTDDDTFQDSLGGETSEEGAAEKPCASVAPVTTNKDLLILPFCDETSSGSTDLFHNIAIQAGVIPKVTSWSTSEQIKSEEMLLLASNTSLPEDAFESEITESADMAPSEMTATSSSVTVKNERVMNEESTDDLSFPNALDLDQGDKTMEEMLSASEMSVDMEKGYLPVNCVTPQDSLDTENSDVMIEAASLFVTSEEMFKDLRPVDVTLPLDSLDEEMDTTVEVISDSALTGRMDQELSLLPSSDALLQDLKDTEQEFNTEAAGDMCSDTDQQSTSAKAVQVSELLNQREDLMGSGDVAATKCHAYTAVSVEKFEEVSFLDLCLEEKVDIFSLDASSLRSVTEQEVTDESVEVPCGQLIVLDEDETKAEPESCSFPSLSHYSQMTELAEPVSYLIRESSCTEKELAAESVSTDSLEDPLMEDSSDDTLTEDTLFDDSWEAQLSKVTHLSLIVEDGSALDGPPEE